MLVLIDGPRVLSSWLKVRVASKVILSRTSIALLRSKRCIAELLLRAGLIHAS